MSEAAEQRTIGVEEEYQIIDPDSRELRDDVQRVLPQAEREMADAETLVQPEFKRSQIEIATPVCQSLADVRRELTRLRGDVISAAQTQGSRIGAAGTHPFSDYAAQAVTPKPRYQSLAEQYRQLAAELVIFGCHVHIGIADRALAIEVMNRSRPWLAVLLALSANSPFWLGKDTGYASFRTELWGRWPIAGPPQPFASYQEYTALVGALVATGSIEDPSRLYWDVRLPEKLETLEFRVTDVCLRIDEAVMVAGLVRALVNTCAAQAQEGKPYTVARPELVRAAHWQAARYGLDGELLDLENNRAVAARTQVESLLAFVQPSLEATNDWNEIGQLVEDVLVNGNGATRQRRAFAHNERMEDVVDFILEETALA